MQLYVQKSTRITFLPTRSDNLNGAVLMNPEGSASSLALEYCLALFANIAVLPVSVGAATEVVTSGAVLLSICAGFLMLIITMATTIAITITPNMRFLYFLFILVD